MRRRTETEYLHASMCIRSHWFLSTRLRLRPRARAKYRSVTWVCRFSARLVIPDGNNALLFDLNLLSESISPLALCNLSLHIPVFSLGPSNTFPFDTRSLPHLCIAPLADERAA